ncbi:beta-L-arabinofuranosidase domain-containing protein [Catalinimonas niigatensis]|uniref:beta-L-arabinofuranosidase domain-containing protein n=1 Tax=Catalinimonas niigatensis TaxID=1397264 RepID=UPI0026661744|nr:beta-L-arabinofuranosidase domain-containing protein [Catalinimonas niigatensis]WPP51675.1 glycoside hydrolase family 127 protein [Catalinimonas niigatensis]
MSKKLFSILLLTCMLACQDNAVEVASYSKNNTNHYRQNRSPLKEKPYLELPLGSIQPTGWLLDQLERMRDGMTGNLDEIYPEVMGKRNGWLGGDGDGWERGPYWIDGLLPLAYLLNDDSLKAKVQPWIEWTLTHQRNDGYLGPIPFEEEPEPEAGLQKSMRRDWWPKMVMLKILQQYYDATGDERVITALTKYFKFQLEELPETPLDHWTLWANRRGGDNLQVVYWLYNITGDNFLLELGELIAEQTFPWTQVFMNEESNALPTSPWHYSRIKRYPFDSEEINSLTVSQVGSMHCVNFAQGLKQPVVYYQQNADDQYLAAVKKALLDMKKYHGQPQGMYGGDEPLHGNNPVQGVEFCSISEEMFSLETMLTITGDMEFADLLEKITYNALPAQASDDFSSRQYFQAANQVELSDQLKISFETQNHGGTDFVFGTLTGYPCCTSNMHQSWPKYVQNLWYATHNGGVAALLYAPSEVNLLVADSVELKVVEETGFPFREEVNFTFSLSKSASFPFHLRIPAWTQGAKILINGTEWEGSTENQTAIVQREWKDGDQVSLRLPMEVKSSQWYEFATAIERGPLVYALKIRDKRVSKDRKDGYRAFEEVYPTDAWNYALYQQDLNNLTASVEVVEKEWNGEYPWNLEHAPIELKMRGVQIPEWKLVNGAPEFPAWWGGRTTDKSQIREITLVPYGCTTLRITEFPVYN